MSGVEPWLTDCLPQSGTGLALDIGANEGAWTIALAHRCYEVHAFEPNPQAHPALRRNTAGLVNVRLFDLALSDIVGDVELNLYEDSAWASAYGADELDAWREGEPLATVMSPLHTLDALGYRKKPVRFVKIDTEGAECDVLEGAAEMIDKQKPALLIEVHSLSNRERVTEFLFNHSYEPELIPHPHPGVPEGHCWIVAGGDA